MTVALNHEQIKSHPKRISIIKPYIDQYDWKQIDFLSNKKDQIEFEKNDKTMALNILYILHNTEVIGHTYKSKCNLRPENQVILLMITDCEK